MNYIDIMIVLTVTTGLTGMIIPMIFDREGIKTWVIVTSFLLYSASILCGCLCWC